MNRLEGKVVVITGAASEIISKLSSLPCCMF